MKLNMTKSADILRLSLNKRGITTPADAEVAFLLDVSGSFDDEHRGGLTQGLLNRLVPWGMVFDPDKKLDVFTFSSGDHHAYHVGDITAETCEGYIKNRIINKVPGYNGGTDYSYVLKKTLQHFGWIQQTTTVQASTPVLAPKKGLFGGLFSKKEQTPEAPQPTVVVEPEVAKKRSIVFFVTDGDNGDKPLTEQVLQESEARGDEVYFLFIGISNQGGNFPFLQKIGDRFSNTGLVVINNLKDFVEKTDEEINETLIGDELIQWLKK